MAEFLNKEDVEYIESLAKRIDDRFLASHCIVNKTVCFLDIPNGTIVIAGNIKEFFEQLKNNTSDILTQLKNNHI